MVVKCIIAICVTFVAYLITVFCVNRFFSPSNVTHIPFRGKMNGPIKSEISVTSWNIGYAGMGEESDFIKDLGSQIRPKSKELVEKNIGGISTQLEKIDTDVYFLQEVSRPCFMTHGVDVYDHLKETLPSYGSAFLPDYHFRFMPPPLNVRIGNAIFTRLKYRDLELRPLAFEPTFIIGTFRKTYRMYIYRIEGPPDWVFINMHLSAFDEPQHSVREEQLRQVVAFAQNAYSAGAHVVAGGDWNMRLSPSTFPHTTEEKYQFWIRDLPKDITPAGWQWVVDPKRPTVRTAHKPYVPGENMTLIVDGFLASPNVEILEVQTTDQGFHYSDHNPVTVRLKATEKPE